MPRIELFEVHKVTAVTQNYANYRFNKKGNANVEQSAYFGVGDVGFFVFLVEPTECQQFLEFLDKRFDDGNAGKTFLSKVGKVGKRLLACVPLHGYVLAHYYSYCQHQHHRYQGKQRKFPIHLEHFVHGHSAEEQRIACHHYAPPETLLQGVQIVGEQRHEISHFVALVKLHGKCFAVIEHSVTQTLFHLYAGNEKANSPCETSQNDDNYHHEQRRTNFIPQIAGIKRYRNAVHHHKTIVDAVYYIAVQFGNFQLEVVHGNKSAQAQYQQRRISHIILVDVFAQNHKKSPRKE